MLAERVTVPFDGSFLSHLSVLFGGPLVGFLDSVVVDLGSALAQRWVGRFNVYLVDAVPGVVTTISFEFHGPI